MSRLPFVSARDVFRFLRTARRLRAAQRDVPRLGVPELLARFTPPLASPPREAAPERLALWVDWWFRQAWFPVRYNCWVRALVLFELLREEGVDGVSLLVGVRTHESALEGHAWLERDGAPFLEPPGRPDLSTLRVIVRHGGE